MVLLQFEYLAPKAIGRACNLLLEFGSPAKVMVRATDLIPPMKDKAVSPEYLVDPEKIPDLDYPEYDEKEGLKIGTLTTLRIIETSPSVKEENLAVAYTVKIVASTQIRTKGTMTGDICNALPLRDTASNLLVQGAKILAQGSNKDRIIQAEDFFLGVKKTSLEPGEIVTGTVIPPLAENERAIYIKYAVRKAMDLAIIDVMIKIRVGDGICIDAHIALGAVATTPIHTPKAEEALIGKALTDEVIVKASEEIIDSCHPISDIHTSIGYCRGMIRVFTKYAVRRAMECL